MILKMSDEKETIKKFINFKAMNEFKKKMEAKQKKNGKDKQTEKIIDYINDSIED